jgi:hypothetical protein
MTQGKIESGNGVFRLGSVQAKPGAAVSEK